MSDPTYRLPADAPHGLGGQLIDPSRPLSFRLNGRTITGYAGDTVLSATLAAGIQIAGRHGDDAIGLDESFAPLIRLADGEPLPMERTPALDGLNLTTVGVRRDPLASRGLFGWLRHRVVGPARTLNHRFGDVTQPAQPWQFAAPVETLTADFAIVGGGIAGLSAAATAIAAGKSVVLIERDPCLGGAAGFFGAVEGEEAPEETIAALVAGISGKANVLTHAEAFAVIGNRLSVHQVTVENGRPSGRVIAVEAAHIILATGALERLPVFPGNRTPGIVGSLAAHTRARRHGVWVGKRALFTTPHSFAYRLALRAADAGIDVQRIVDSRIAPVSRFVDFAKASGVTLASALAPSQAEPLQRNKPGLRVGFAVNMAEIAQDSSAIETDQLVAAGGWQPDLLLWLRAGGSAAWDTTNCWLAATGSLPQVRLAGSAAGLRSTAAAIASGKAAVLASLGKAAPPIADAQIDEMFETRDAPTSIAPFRSNAPGASYLDRGGSLVTRRAAAASKHGVSSLATRAVQLSLGDIAAAVDIGAISSRDAGPVASERCGIGGEISDSGWQVAPHGDAAPGVPAPPVWLTGRFGDKPQLWAIAAADARNFTPGGLVFENSQTTDPLKAIGVVYAPPRHGAHGAIAMFAQTPEAKQLFVRDAGTAVEARLTERVKAGA